jgi:hypothetical protein
MDKIGTSRTEGEFVGRKAVKCILCDSLLEGEYFHVAVVFSQDNYREGQVPDARVRYIRFNIYGYRCCRDRGDSRLVTEKAVRRSLEVVESQSVPLYSGKGGGPAMGKVIPAR